ncbi:MAG: hypothetical protein RLZZ336_372 [Cyanobacteriota bacterium]
MFALLGQPIVAPVVASERLQLEDFNAYPPQPKIDINLDDGSTCSVTDRAPPTLVLYGRQLNSIDRPFGSQQGLKNDLGGGVALMIPLGPTGFRKACTGLLRLQEGRAKMALANQLLEAGQITEAEMKKVVDGLRAVLGI